MYEGKGIMEEERDSLTEIYKWIDQIPFSKPKKNIARDFSDGVFMAELLKRYYPRHVDVHNYIPGNSVAKKIDNWCTLNRKVLSKIGMKISKEVINQLANSQPGVIEKVLADLKRRILLNSNADRDSLYGECDENSRAETLQSVLDPEEVANKTVPRYIFEKLKQELKEKDEIIQTMQQKISHLESIMKLKEQRILDLSSQFSKSEPSVSRNVRNVFSANEKISSK